MAHLNRRYSSSPSSQLLNHGGELQFASRIAGLLSYACTICTICTCVCHHEYANVNANAIASCANQLWARIQAVSEAEAELNVKL